MPRPPATAAQRSEQRHKIRQAAADLYAADGIGAVSVRAVASRAGMSQGAIYSYFSNLGELMRSLWLEPVAAASRRLEQIAAEVTDPVKRLRSLLESFVEFAIANPDVYRGALMFVRPSSATAPERAPLDEVKFFTLVTDALSEAHTKGLVAIEDPRVSAELLWAGLHGSLALSTNVDIYEVTPPETLAPAMVDLLMRSVVVSHA